MKLKTKLLLLSLVFCSIVIVMFGLLTGLTMNSANEAAMISEQQSVKDNCEVLLNRYKASGFSCSSAEEAKIMAEELHTFFLRPIAVYNAEGKLYYATDGYSHEKEATEKVQPEGKNALVSFISKNGSMKADLELSISSEQIENGGIVCIQTDYSNEYTRMTSIVQRQIISSAVIIFVVFVFMVLNVLSAIKPVSSLTMAVNRYLESGKFEHAQQKTAKDEIGIFISGFNQMTDTISTQMETIEREKESLSEALKYRKEFFDRVTHELKTPITIISGYAEMAKKNISNERLSKEALSVIEKETARLHSYVTELLQASKDTLSERLSKESFDISAMIVKLAESMSIRARRYGTDIRLSVEPDRYIYADPERIRQIIVNLIDNAIKYGVPGRTINLELSLDKQNAIITVSNYVEERIVNPSGLFIPYLQDRDETETGSIGLGLSICMDIALAHSGNIEARMKTPEIIEFKVTIPTGKV